MWEGPEAGTVAQLASLPLLFMLLGPGTSTAAVTKWQFFLRKRNPPVYMRLASVLLVAAWAVLPGPTAGERTVNNVIKKTKENEKKKPTHLHAVNISVTGGCSGVGGFVQVSGTNSR